MPIIPAGLSKPSSAAKRAKTAASLGFISPTPKLNITVPKSSPTPFGSVPSGPYVPAAPPKTALATIPSDHPLATPAVQQWSPEEYQRQIEADPVYRAALTANQGTKDQQRNALTSAIRQAIIGSGYTPDLSGNLSAYASDVDPATLATAAQNQFSTKAQLDRSYNDSLSDLPYQLAARGALRSGAAPAAGSQLDQAYQLQSHNALTGLQAAINGQVTDYLNAGLTADQALAQARADTASRLAQLPGTAPTESDLGISPQEARDQGVIPPQNQMPQPANGVSWGGQTFTTKAALSRWLSARGSNYASWASNHPDAARRLK